MTIVRWILMVPAAIAAWYGVFMLALVTHSFFERQLCPPEDLISGACVNETVQQHLKRIVHLYVALSAFAVVVTAAVTAPAKRLMVAWVALLVGTVVATYMASTAKEWPLLGSAVAGGALAAGAITYYLNRMSERKDIRGVS